jgi:FkbM family methyltransferase
MEHRMDRLSKEWAFPKDRVSLVQAGLSDKPGEMSFTFVEDFPIRHGLVSQESDNSNKSKGTIPVYTLDQYLAGKPATFLKADIEGMEMQFLRGAVETIKKYKPKMAICAYHYPSDLYEIIEYVRTIVPEYRFCMRNHAPIFGDFVLYCYVE